MFNEEAPSVVPVPGESKRDANRRARRLRILDAARELIVAEGMAALSMRRLAEVADVSVMTLYNLFGGKDEILEALIDAAVDAIDARLAEEAPVDADPIGRCRAVITVSIDHFTARPAVYKSMMLAHVERLAAGEGDPARVAGRGTRMQQEGLAAAVDQGLLRPDTDTVSLASQIYHGYELAFIQWAHGQIDTAGFEARARYGLELALLATCTDEVRPELQACLDAAAAALRATAAPTSTTIAARPA